MRESRGGGAGGPDTTLENHKNIVVFNNTGPYPVENDKATKPADHGPL